MGSAAAAAIGSLPRQHYIVNSWDLSADWSQPHSLVLPPDYLFGVIGPFLIA